MGRREICTSVKAYGGVVIGEQWFNKAGTGMVKSYVHTTLLIFINVPYTHLSSPPTLIIHERIQPPGTTLK